MKASLATRMAMVICIAVALGLYSCKKDSSSTQSANSNENVSTAGDDQAQVSDESDAITNDVSTALNPEPISPVRIIVRSRFREPRR